MEPKEKINPQQFIIDRLHEVQKKIEDGKFAEALENLKEVKSADAKNIYIIAIERQIVKATDPTITEKNKSDITNSLPAMFERALSDTQRRAEALKQSEVKNTKGKEAALEKLKSQYFQRTDDYVAKGDYAHALEEIRRIYIIEPDSVVAKEYEQKIEQLAKLQQKSEESPSEEKEAEKEAKKEEKKEAKKKAKEEAKEEAAPPKETVPQIVEPPQPADEAPKSKTLLVAGFVVMAAVIGVIIFFVLSSRKKQEEPTPAVAAAQQQPASQIPAAAPAEVKENGPAKEAEEEKLKQSELKKQESKLAAAAVQQKLQAEQKQAASAAANQAGSKTGSNPATTTAGPAPTGTATTSAAQPPVQQQPAAPQQSGPIDAPHPFVAIENPIQILKLAAPSYPEIAYRMGLNGKVIVEVTVDQQGKPIQATIAKSTSDIFNDASISAAMKSTYKPAMMSTGPITAKVYVPFTFKIGR